jgi:hypothetical protein
MEVIIGTNIEFLSYSEEQVFSYLSKNKIFHNLVTSLNSEHE